MNSFGNNLTIRIPRLANTSRPNVTLRAIEQDYQLNELRLVPRSQTYNFHWSTYVLKKAGIFPTDLRAIASTGSQIVYIPVIIGSPSNQYEFVFYSSSNLTTRKAFGKLPPAIATPPAKSKFSNSA